MPDKISMFVSPVVTLKLPVPNGNRAPGNRSTVNQTDGAGVAHNSFHLAWATAP